MSTLRIKKILISQPQPSGDKSPYTELESKYGVSVDFKPFIRVEGVTVAEVRRNRLNVLEYTAIIFTSRTAIDHFFRLCNEMRVTIPVEMKFFCTSEAISLYLQKYVVYRKRKVFFGEKTFADLCKIIAKHKTEHYFLPLSDVHNDEMPKMLDALKINHTEMVLYRTVANDLVKDIPDLNTYSIVALFTPSGILSLLQNYPNLNQENLYLATFGLSTFEAAKNAGLRVDIQAPNEKATSMQAAIEQFIKAYNKENKIK